MLYLPSITFGEKMVILKKKEIKKQEQEGFPKILDVAEIYLDA